MRSAVLVLAALALCATPAVAQDDPEVELSPETILVTQEGVEFSVRDFDVASKRIPEDMRPGYMADFDRVVRDLSSLLALKVISERARAEGYADRPDIKAELALTERRLMSARYIDDWVAAQPEPDYEQMAKEQYLLNRKDYQEPETVDVRHILIKNDRRSSEEAFELASEVLEKAKNATPEEFGELAREYSEDRGSSNSGGIYRRAPRTELVKPFADAAFAAEELDKAYGPVETEFGYHVMMTHARYEPRIKPFEEVKGRIIPGLRQAHLTSLRQDYMDEVRAGDKDVNAAAIRSLRDFYAGDALEALRNLDQ